MTLLHYKVYDLIMYRPTTVETDHINFLETTRILLSDNDNQSINVNLNN